MGLADELKDLIYNQTGLEGHELLCPREKSDMTPCVARDGDLATTDDGKCVGCGADIIELLNTERAKHG